MPIGTFITVGSLSLAPAGAGCTPHGLLTCQFATWICGPQPALTTALSLTPFLVTRGGTILIFGQAINSGAPGEFLAAEFHSAIR